jgi:trehalose 6-phosphate synthase/phosphatase
MKVILVSNRLPQTLAVRRGSFELNRSIGGVTTALTSLLHTYSKPYTWIGWPGMVVPDHKKHEAKEIFASEMNSVPVFLSKEEVKNYYQGFCNRVIWPLFHYATANIVARQEYWIAYKKVNQLFAEEIATVYEAGDLIFIQDYHLLLLPQLIRQDFPQARIGFFLHIPFPTYEIFRILPKKWQEKLLQGVLAADVIGFHTKTYVDYFRQTANKVLAANSKKTNQIGAFPYSIDPQSFLSSKKRDQKLTRSFHKTILSIDRLDYTKGIPERLEGYRYFLSKHPEFHRRVTLLAVVVPSRTAIPEYQQLKKKVDTLVGEINGMFGDLSWQPIRYQYGSYSEEKLKKLYKKADIALITPLRDGMNLIAKEFIISRDSGEGVLILSEFAGAAEELTEALLVNPQSVSEISHALMTALTMPPAEQKKRNQMMQQKIIKHDISWWFNSFMKSLEEKEAPSAWVSLPTISKAAKRMIFLDYDGTLVPFASTPEAAKPTPRVLKTLLNLTGDPTNHVAIVSGRKRQNLDDWFGHLPLTLIAEHGAYMKYNHQWQSSVGISKEWWPSVKKLFKECCVAVPLSFIEEKESSIAWHYRLASQENVHTCLQKLDRIKSVWEAQFELALMFGNKVVECKQRNSTKGSAVKLLLHQEKPECIIAMGDDVTDEDMFKALPSMAVTIKVGAHKTQAKFRLQNTEEVIRFLNAVLPSCISANLPSKII